MDKRKAQLQTTQMFSQGKREKKEKERNKRENDIKERINQ